MHDPEAERVEHPGVLRVAIAVLVGAQRVGDALDRVDHRAGEVVSRVDLPLGAVASAGQNRTSVPSAMMRLQIAAVDDRVAKSLVRVVGADLRAQAPARALGRARDHLLEARADLGRRHIAMLRRQAMHALMPHLRA